MMIKNLVDSEYLELTIPDDVYNAVLLDTSDHSDKNPYNHALAGNIKKEFELTSCRPYVKKFVEHEVLKWKGVHSLTDLWVNYMASGEFNPPHAHGGAVSFVMFITIPYDIQDELNVYNQTSSSCSGHFSFHFANMFGRLCEEILPVDRSWEKRMLMFPSELKHSVYPFYTSDEYRITVSGNLRKL